MSTYNLIFEKWIPIRRKCGRVEAIAPFEITGNHADNPILAFSWPRPDFDLASHEFLIGLLAAIYPDLADRFDPNQWTARFHEPPTSCELKSGLAPLAKAFELDGEGPRFLQDWNKLNGEELPIESLLIGAPGENTIKSNKDFFVKRGQIKVLSRAAAAIALYTLQQFAPSGGAGHRTSLRGGGPLVTLALPGENEGSAPTLWQRLWLNVPPNLHLNPNASQAEHAHAFPWLAQTRTSENGEVVNEDQEGVHPLQALFGMPRRIRLVFKRNTGNLRCDLTGVIDEVVCTGYVARPRGVNYGVWRHPLTPYHKLKSASTGSALPVHAPPGRLGYREWLGLVFEDAGGHFPAKTIVTAKSRLWDLGSPWTDNSRILAGGYATDNMKVLAFTEAEMPLHSLDPEIAGEVERLARLMVHAASVAVDTLAYALRQALFEPHAAVRGDPTVLAAPCERFWELTEDEFHQMLDAAPTTLATDPDGEKQEGCAKSWRETLERVGLRIFDDTAPIDAFGELDPERIVEAREHLVLLFKGCGNSGAKFFKQLGLEPPKKSPIAHKTKEQGASAS